MKTIKSKALTLFAAACLGLGLLQAEASLITNTYTPVVDCPAPGQLCNKTFDVSIQTTGTLLVRFAASSTHCSAIYMHFVLDGQEVALAGPLGAGQSTTNLDLGPVAAGLHALQLRGEGLLGGCNVGDIINWGGVLDVVTSIPCGELVALAVERTGTNVVLSWPASGSDYVLESATTLPNLGGWTLEGASPTLADGRLWHTNAVIGPARFYRLRSDCPP